MAFLMKAEEKRGYVIDWDALVESDEPTSFVYDTAVSDALGGFYLYDISRYEDFVAITIDEGEGLVWQLEKNEPARHMLHRLGFDMTSFTPHGDVLLLGRDGGPVPKERLEMVQKRFEAVCKELPSILDNK